MNEEQEKMWTALKKRPFKEVLELYDLRLDTAPDGGLDRQAFTDDLKAYGWTYDEWDQEFDRVVLEVQFVFPRS